MAGPTKPIHPAAVHFPIAFLALAFGLDILTFASPRLPASITSQLLPQPDLHKISYYALTLGLATSVPAVLTGGVEAVKLISKQGMYEADGKTLRTKVKATFAHAITMDTVLAVATYIWMTRRALVTESFSGKMGLATAYSPADWMVGVEAGLMAVFLFSAGIGGTLVYNYGVGFQSLSAGSKKTQ
ncbi:Hypothetical protein R9X50_00453000 [Acrodontium crateriforme]|uniref:DUF2231 domain-containing protein n=1 Tax=Acrodontium crateriforme TaxID=150365 RepID=A0AAQ3RCT9_9PEZI|nr:Hypothetical protein R9X50_00453000 [Acrodontium crateriforme]